MKFVDTRCYTSYLILFACFVYFAASAQDVSNTETHESESETIAKCIQDLKANDVDVRKRAVLILGKYSNIQAQKAVVGMLSDENADIRRSALVSLTEKPIPREAILPMLSSIGDLDVHVRRIASSYIPEIMRQYRFPRPMGQYPQGRNVFSDEIKSIIINAFRDPDAIVRKNMITNYYYFKKTIPKETIVSLLNDDERDIRILALDACKNSLSNTQFINATKVLADDPDRLIRLRLVELLMLMPESTAIEILNKLVADDDFEISTTAILAKFKRSDHSVVDELLSRLDHPNMHSQLANKFIVQLPKMRNKGEEILRDLIVNPQQLFRVNALTVYGNAYWQTADTDMCIELLQDPSEEMRMNAGKILLRTSKLSSDDLSKLAYSEYHDVRSVAVQLSKNLSNDQARSVLEELLLDDNSQIRLLTLKEIVRRNYSDWNVLIKQTLDGEDDYQLVRGIIHYIVGHNSPIRDEILSNFVKTTEFKDLRHYVLRKWKPKNQVQTQ